MKRDFAALTDREFDVVVIGGGAYGACAAWEAASRGMTVALIEMNDFCGATSANHLRMIHGGIRYLQHFDLKRVRESCRERSALMRIAPNLVRPIPILMPTRGAGMEGKHVLRAGLALYDMIVLDRNIGIRDRSRRIPRGTIVGKDKCRELVPEVDLGAFNGAGLFYDGQFLNPSRLALAFLHSAAAAGGTIVNYAEAQGFLFADGQVAGITVKDKMGGETVEVRAKNVLNTAGPWATALLANIPQLAQTQSPPFSRDTGFLVRRRLTGNHALACRIGSKDPDAVLSRQGRHIFLVPWHDYTLVGVWHKVHSDGPENIGVDASELASYVEEIRSSELGIDIDVKDISMVYSGLTLFGENDESSNDLRFGHRSLFIDHAVQDGIDGIVTLVGVRATTARGLAEKAINLVAKKIGKRISPSKTTTTPLFGSDIDDIETFCGQACERYGQSYDAAVLRQLVQNHGTQYEKVIDFGTSNDRFRGLVGNTGTLAAEVAYSVENEMALTLKDVVFRRTEIGMGGNPGDAALTECANMMGSLLGWSADRKTAELDAVRNRFPSIS